MNKTAALGKPVAYAMRPCSLGWLLVAVSGDQRICAVLIGDGPEFLQAEIVQRLPHSREIESDRMQAILDEVANIVDHPAHGVVPSFPLDVQGTPFQRRVWETVRAIPPGTTITYTALAARLDMPRAARAVAAACAANRHAVVIPCHRVVAKGGVPGGYRWGTERKGMLLEMEARDSRHSAR